MKMIVLLIFMLAMGLFHSVNLVMAQSDQPQATLEETMDFIKNKIESNSYIDKGNNKHEYSMHVNGCNITITARNYFHDDESKWYCDNKHYINLKDIAKTNVEVSDNYKIMSLTTYNKYNKIREDTDCSYKDGKWSPMYKYYSDIYFVDLNSDIPERIAKAFNHAANICGGGQANAKKEPF